MASEVASTEMEIVITNGEENKSATEATIPHKKNRIQVSSNKKPLYFYVNLAKRYMQQHNEIELSALGMAIGTVVTVAEILKNNGLATEKQILTSTVGTKDEAKGRLIRKAKIEILMGKSSNFDQMMAANKTESNKVRANVAAAAATKETKEDNKMTVDVEESKA